MFVPIKLLLSSKHLYFKTQSNLSHDKHIAGEGLDFCSNLQQSLYRLTLMPTVQPHRLALIYRSSYFGQLAALCRSRQLRRNDARIPDMWIPKRPSILMGTMPDVVTCQPQEVQIEEEKS